MAETRVLVPILRLVDEAEGKAILVGDAAQLPAVGAGGLYGELCERLGAIGLLDNQRQHDVQERAVLSRLRAGDPEPYLAHAAAQGRLHVEQDPAAAKHRLLRDWWAAVGHGCDDAFMLAYRRADVRDLNRAAHVLMLRAGALGPTSVQLGEREFRVGDRAVCRRNDSGLGLRNGMRGTVADLDPLTRTLTLQVRGAAPRRIPAAYASEHLDYAYALTGHAAQGATVDHAFVLLRDEGALREWSYVAFSRARTATSIYATGGALEHDVDRPLVDRKELTARALERPATESPAVAHARDRTADALGRLHEQRRAALATAEARLTAAEDQLQGIGRLGRRPLRAELRREVARRHAEVRLARQQLESASMKVCEPRLPRRPLLHAVPNRPSRSTGVALERSPGIQLEL
jgi:hypothetical protein